MKNYYSILGIKISASNVEIKKAYRTLSKKLHPDVNPAGVEQFKDINEANAILSTEKRKDYDIKHKALFGPNQTNTNYAKPSNTNKTKVKTNTNNFTKNYTTNKGSQSTIIVNGVKINVNTGSNITQNINIVNGQVIIETIYH